MYIKMDMLRLCVGSVYVWRYMLRLRIRFAISYIIMKLYEQM
jgi:hypothetical protein